MLQPYSEDEANKAIRSILLDFAPRGLSGSEHARAIGKEDEIMGENGANPNGNAAPRDDLAGTAEDTRLILNDELNSAATPFFYLLSILVIAVAAYLLYSLLR